MQLISNWYFSFYTEREYYNNKGIRSFSHLNPIYEFEKGIVFIFFNKFTFETSSNALESMKWRDHNEPTEKQVQEYLISTFN